MVKHIADLNLMCLLSHCLCFCVCLSPSPSHPLSHLSKNLRIWAENQNLDLLAINETRLNSTISKDQFKLFDYDLIRRDRNRNGGGVCMCIRSTINVKNRSHLLPDSIEALCLEI